MKSSHKFSLPFVLALSLHLAILALFGVNFMTETEIVKQKALPEIIQASILDDEKILEEAERLNANEKNKQLVEKKQQQELEKKRKDEQALLLNAKREREQEEKKIQALEKKRKQQQIKEKQQELVKKQKAEEAARKAKIKQQQVAEQKRQDDLLKAKENKRLETKRKAEEKRRESERNAEQKRKHALEAKKKSEEAEKAALLIKQAEAASAKIQQDKKATLSATVAIQQKVNQRWIKPQTSKQGLRCTIRVKLLPSGDVMNAAVIKTSGDSVFDRSAENAVRKASPLPVPRDRNLFAKQFRTFIFEFIPE